MAQHWNMKWFDESAPICPHWLHAMTFPIKHPSAAALMSTFDDFKLKEPQMSSETDAKLEAAERLAVYPVLRDRESKAAKIAESVNALIEETEFSKATSKELGLVAEQNSELRAQNVACRNRNFELELRLENQKATIENYQGRILDLEQGLDLSELATFKAQLKGQADHIKGLEAKVERLTPQADETVKSKLERALHTQKILERDLEEYQQAYADLKASVFSDDDRTLPPRLLEFGHGEYLVYPAKVYLEDDDQDPKWGIVIDPTTDVDVEEYLKPLAGKDVVLTDGDVAITFEKPADVARLIQTLEDLRYRMMVESVFGEQ